MAQKRAEVSQTKKKNEAERTWKEAEMARFKTLPTTFRRQTRGKKPFCRDSWSPVFGVTGRLPNTGKRYGLSQLCFRHIEKNQIQISDRHDA